MRFSSLAIASNTLSAEERFDFSCAIEYPSILILFNDGSVNVISET
jgi:hypothetical protein